MTVVAATTSDSWNTRLTLFYRKLLTREIIDQNYANTATFNHFKRNNKRATDAAGNWDVPVSNAGSPLGGEFSGWTPTSVAGIETATTARTQAAFYYEPVRAAKTEIWTTKGGESLARILAHRTSMAMKRMMTKLQSHIVATSQASSIALMPLPVIIATTPTSGSISNISRTDNTWWRNQTDAAGYSFATDGPKKMETGGRAVSLNAGTLTFDRIFTTDTIYGFMQNAARSHGEFTFGTVAGAHNTDLGTTIFHHKKPVHYDSGLPSGRIYWITDDALQLHVVPGVEFFVDDPVDLSGGGQHGYVKNIYWGGQLVPYELAKLGQHSSVVE
jgi:hypothetical protein